MTTGGRGGIFRPNAAASKVYPLWKKGEKSYVGSQWNAFKSSAPKCTVRSMTKDELIEHLLESESKAGSTKKEEDGEALSLTKHLMMLIIQMQKEQQTWLEVQQKKQEKLMQRNQQIPKEMVDAVLATQAPPTEAPSGSGRVKPPKPTLQKLSASDDIESYLAMFERVARQQGWSDDTWATQLAGLLSADALDAFTSMPAEAERNYAQVREAILARFEVNAEAYRLRFCSTRRQ